MYISQEVSNAIIKATQLAKEWKHEYVTSEHILLAMCDEKIFKEAFESCDGDCKQLKEDLTEYLQENMETSEEEPIESFSLQSSTTLTSTVPKIPVSTVCSAAHKHTPACLRTRAVVKTKTPSAATAIPNATIKATGVTVTVPVICRNAVSTPTRILATTDSTAQRLRQLQPKNDIFFTSHSNICLPAVLCAVVQQWVKLRFLQCRNDRMQFSKAACRVIIEKKRKECPIWNNSSSLCGSV